jgi:hypothetical protein
MDISKLDTEYEFYKENSLPFRHYKYSEYNDVIKKHQHKSFFKFWKEEFSFEGRKINIIEYGTGAETVLIWSQMHGNEPVSTLSLMDCINFLCADYDSDRFLFNNLRIVMIPLLNPDGNELFDRRNAQGIDINRDARTLISPEARILTEVHGKVNPKFALNLHDQELYYTSKPLLLQTVLAMLAPECDDKKSVTPTRLRAMKVISEVYCKLRGLTEGRVARYTDDFTPSAFGDTFMERGTSSILIESGSISGDKDRKFARKVVFLAIINALTTIANKSYEKQSAEVYNNLPDNQRYNGYDLKINNLTVETIHGSYTLDLGIRRIKPSHNPEDFTDDFSDYRIANIGKLDTFGGIKVFDASGWKLCGNYTKIRMLSKADFDITDGNTILNISKLL